VPSPGICSWILSLLAALRLPQLLALGPGDTRTSATQESQMSQLVDHCDQVVKVGLTAVERGALDRAAMTHSHAYRADNPPCVSDWDYGDDLAQMSRTSPIVPGRRRPVRAQSAGDLGPPASRGGRRVDKTEADKRVVGDVPALGRRWRIWPGFERLAGGAGGQGLVRSC
jgi:hypothetical protein